MNKLSVAIMVIFLVFAMKTVVAADEGIPTAAKTKQRDWHFNANISYTSRAMDGNIVNKTAISGGAFGDLIATADSMNLDTSDGVMLTIGAQYKKWGLGINYTPTSFSGNGSALVGLSGSQAGVVTKTPLDSNIDVDMLLANLAYNIIQTKNTIFGVGVGLGQTYIDLNITPEVGNAIIYDGEQPFGFLNLHMINKYQKFLYGFSINAISATFTGVKVEYSDYKIDLGYRIINDTIKWDIVGGYRLVNFSIDIENGEDVVQASIDITGPFLGVTVSY